MSHLPLHFREETSKWNASFRLILSSQIQVQINGLWKLKEDQAFTYYLVISSLALGLPAFLVKVVTWSNHVLLQLLFAWRKVDTSLEMGAECLV